MELMPSTATKDIAITPQVSHAQFMINIIYGIHIFLFRDWLKVCHVVKNKLTIVQKLPQNHKCLFQAVDSLSKPYIVFFSIRK